jgi:hypothetical protein
MQRCPKCGYREGDGPTILAVMAFATLFLVFILTTDHAPMSIRIMGLAAFFAFSGARSWRAFRARRNQREYLKLHPPLPSPDERVKSHFKPATPGR